MKTIRSALWFFCAPVAVWSITFHGVDNRVTTLPSFQQGSTVFVSAAKLNHALEGKHQWRGDLKRLMMMTDSVSIQVIADNPFVKAGGRMFQCRPLPVMKGGDLYVPVDKWTNILNRVLPKYLVWEPDSVVLSALIMGVKIKDIVRKVEGNTTVAEIHTSAPVRFEWEYHQPTMILNVTEALVASTKLSSSEPKGFIQKVEVYQLTNAAQISFLFQKGIGKPEVRQERNPNRVIVSLRKSEVETGESAPMGNGGTVIDKRQKSLNTISTIVIDPGHGGKDPGAIGPDSLLEKDIVLSISLKLRDFLQKEGIRVILTRHSDVFVELKDRTKLANEKGADLFLSVHCNSLEGSKRRLRRVYGYKAYINSVAKSDDDKLVAMKENAVIEFEDEASKKEILSESQAILLDMISSEFLHESEDWATMIIDEMQKAVKRSRKLHTGIGQARFYVLNGAYMPCVLMETAFISNPNEAQLLKTQTFQTRIAKALCKSILQFKKKYERRG